MPENPVRRIGTFNDLDGFPVAIGIDHDALTITFGGTTARLNSQQRQALHALIVATVVAIDTWIAERGDDDA
jgi:hypothetical protein